MGYSLTISTRADSKMCILLVQHQETSTQVRQAQDIQKEQIKMSFLTFSPRLLNLTGQRVIVIKYVTRMEIQIVDVSWLFLFCWFLSCFCCHVIYWLLIIIIFPARETFQFRFLGQVASKFMSFWDLKPTPKYLVRICHIYINNRSLMQCCCI